MALDAVCAVNQRFRDSDLRGSVLRWASDWKITIGQFTLECLIAAKRSWCWISRVWLKRRTVSSRVDPARPVANATRKARVFDQLGLLLPEDRVQDVLWNLLIRVWIERMRGRQRGRSQWQWRSVGCHCSSVALVSLGLFRWMRLPPLLCSPSFDTQSRRTHAITYRHSPTSWEERLGRGDYQARVSSNAFTSSSSGVPPRCRRRQQATIGQCLQMP